MTKLDQPKGIRIKFEKTGRLQFISHLDLHRTFSRALTRSGVPVWRTQGFNPHQKLVFATPLSVGAQSKCEYLDIKIDREMSCDAIHAALSAQLPPGLCVTRVSEPVHKIAALRWAEYEIAVGDTGADTERVYSILTQRPLVVVKRTKSGEAEADISGAIARVAVERDSNTITITAILSADSASFLNPEYLMKVLRERYWPTEQPLCEITRTAVYLADGETAFE